MEGYTRKDIIERLKAFKRGQKNPRTERLDFWDAVIAEIERTGKWRKEISKEGCWDKVRYYCSECGDWQTYGKTDFCPSCGARMESEE